MRSKEEIKQWLLANCINQYGDLDLSRLDFSDFDGSINFSHMKVKSHIFLGSSNVKGNIFQSNQHAQGSIYQECQTTEHNLYQGCQHVEGTLYSQKLED